MPFAGYKDFADCVARNRDKSDPEAYCASIKHRIEDSQSRAKEEVHKQRARHRWWIGHL